MLFERKLGIDANLGHVSGPDFPAHALDIVNFGPGVRCVLALREPTADPLVSDLGPAAALDGQERSTGIRRQLLCLPEQVEL